MTAVQDGLKMLYSAYHRGAPLALLFDFDGTLAEIVDHPGMARVEAEVLQLLERLRELPRVAIAVLSLL